MTKIKLFEVGDDLFHVLEDCQAVLRSKGTFFQKKLYRRGNRIYAAWGSGFIRIGAGDATSNPNVAIESMDLNFDPVHDAMKNPLIHTRAPGVGTVRAA